MSDTCSVLVVEDEALVREVLAEVLSQEGFAVKSAADGRDALAVLERWQPDVILTDLSMPRMDGWTFREELRRRTNLADIPVIVLSAAVWDRDRLAALDAVEFMPKPCDLDALVDAVRRAVGAKRPEALEAFPALPTHENISGGPMVAPRARGESRH